MGNLMKGAPSATNNVAATVPGSTVPGQTPPIVNMPKPDVVANTPPILGKQDYPVKSEVVANTPPIIGSPIHEQAHTNAPVPTPGAATPNMKQRFIGALSNLQQGLQGQEQAGQQAMASQQPMQQMAPMGNLLPQSVQPNVPIYQQTADPRKQYKKY